MKRYHNERSASEEPLTNGGGERTKDRSTDRAVYDLSTPLWSKYYHKVRKRIRFPRYYKRALNW
ncbi:MAG: hypothetical protein KDC00_07025 [Flavobacteriales bacterium]|nr:hypothetical protein [Flavobacteriales bacterium]